MKFQTYFLTAFAKAAVANLLATVNDCVSSAILTNCNAAINIINGVLSCLSDLVKNLAILDEINVTKDFLVVSKSEESSSA